MKKTLCIILLSLVFAFPKIEAQLVFPHLKVLYDSGWAYKNLHLIPIRFNDSVCNDKSLPPSFLTLKNAMQSKKIAVKENVYTKEANVNVITVKNLSKEFILITSGELLKGGKQDRMIAETKIIAPGKEAEYLSVYCVEKGRWSAKAKPFSYAGYANIKLRKAADSSGVQQHVWKEIEKQFSEDNIEINNYPFIEMKGKKKNSLTDYYSFFIEKFKQSDSLYAGFIAISDSTIIGCDIFANEKLLVAEFENILSSYVDGVKSVDNMAVLLKPKVENFTDLLLGSEVSQKKFLEHNGKAFVYQNKTFHITAYGN